MQQVGRAGINYANRILSKCHVRKCEDFNKKRSISGEEKLIVLLN